MGEAILIASGKGGVGKTVFAANMGAALAKSGASVVLIDMNIGMRNLDICMGLESRVIYDLTDAIIGICSLKKALVKDRRFESLYLISAAQTQEKAKITPAEMRDLCQELKEKHDYVIIDAPSGIGAELQLAAAGADRAVIVTTAEYGALRDADALDRVLERIGIVSRSFVVNDVKEELLSRGAVPDLQEISESMRIPMAGGIPHENNVIVSVNIGVPVVMEEGSYFERNFRRIIQRILQC